jgi:hypothetical protein
VQRLINILLSWNNLCAEFLGSYDTNKLKMRCGNVIRVGEKMFKSYDYRNSLKQESERRSHKYYEPFMAGYVEELAEDDLVIISYDRIHGSHSPSCLRHLLDICKALQDLHALGIVHGDIRLSNMIFCNFDTSSLECDNSKLSPVSR